MLAEKSSVKTKLQRPHINWTRLAATGLLYVLIAVWTAANAQCSDTAPHAWPAAVGAPVATNAAKAPDVRILCNSGFVIGYDRERGRAAWVAYRVTPVADYHHRPRPKFKPDPRVEHAAPRQIYWQPEYDRGHMAPNYAMAQLYGRAAQRASFYFSNIEPQSPRLNQLLWQRLEEIEIDRLAPKLDQLWVLVGPIYTAADTRVPSAFFRIWLGRNSADKWQAMAFRVPQRVRGDERLDQFLVAIDAIEQATGLDFFSNLPQPLEQQLEAHQADADLWGFAALACMPARYRKHWRNRDGIRLRFDRCD